MVDGPAPCSRAGSMIAPLISSWYRSGGSRAERRALMNGLDRLKVVLVTRRTFIRTRSCFSGTLTFRRRRRGSTRSSETRNRVARPRLHFARRARRALSLGVHAPRQPPDPRAHASTCRCLSYRWRQPYSMAAAAPPMTTISAGCSRALSMPARKRRSSAGVYTLMSPHGASQRPRRSCPSPCSSDSPTGVPEAASSCAREPGPCVPAAPQRTAAPGYGDGPAGLPRERPVEDPRPAAP